MKAIAKTRNSKGLDLLNIEEPREIGDNEVLVQVDAVSICGTDLHIYNWDTWAEKRIKLPRILGHEGTGVVIKTGKNVNLNPGQRVSFESHIPCFNCYQCKTRNYHICSNLRLLGVDVDGLFRKYVVVPSYVVVPNDLESEEASILEPLGNAFHCLQKVDIRGKYIGILGDGPIALFLFYYAQKFGASKIFLVGASEYRLKFAKEINYQNHQILNFYEDKVSDVISKETKGRMLDVIFEMAGSNDTVNLGLEILTMGGKFVAFGILPNNITFDYNSLIFKSIDIISINGRVLFDSWYLMMDTIKKGELKKFVTHVIDFENYDQAFNLLLDKKAIKVVIKI